MAKYIIKRVAMSIFSIFIVATVTFFVMNLVPGGPFVAEKSISAAAQQALAEKYGLDKPPAGLYLGLQPRQVAGQHHHRVRNLRHCDPELYFQRAAAV